MLFIPMQSSQSKDGDLKYNRDVSPTEIFKLKFDCSVLLLHLESSYVEMYYCISLFSSDASYPPECMFNCTRTVICEEENG